MSSDSPPEPLSFRAAACDLAWVFLPWLASLAVINPSGNFPLNDDWSFAITVRNLLETGEFRPTGWTSMPLLTNVLWGALFCLPLGFSFDVLRLSTLVMSALGIAGCYFLCRELRLPRKLATIAAATLAFNPIYYVLSCTFMTDVPYTTLSIGTALFLVRHLRTHNSTDLLLGTLLALAATLSRQLGLSIPLGFAVALLLSRGWNYSSIFQAATPGAVSAIGLFGFQQWLTVMDRLPALYHAKTDKLLAILDIPGMSALTLALTSYMSLYYLGWFLFPCLTFCTASLVRAHWQRASVLLGMALAAIIALAGVYFLYTHAPPLMPSLGNIIFTAGIGPRTLRDIYIERTARLPPLPLFFWQALTVLGACGASCLLATFATFLGRLITRFRARTFNHRDAAGVCLLLSTAVYLLPVMALRGFMDRYLMPTLPLLATSLLLASTALRPAEPGPRGLSCYVSWLTLTGTALFAICGTHDYLAWNRARWDAMYQLASARAATPRQIDGGLEFNGFHLYDPTYQRQPGKSWWWVHDDEYRLGIADTPGYQVIHEQRFSTWMPPGNARVVILQRVQPAQFDPQPAVPAPPSP